VTVYLLHAPGGTRHSFVPKKVINFGLENLRRSLEGDGHDVVVLNGQRSGPIAGDFLAARLRADDWLICPLIEGAAVAPTLAFAIDAAQPSGARTVATSQLATFAPDEIRALFPALDHVVLGEDEVVIGQLVSGELRQPAPVLRADPVPPQRWRRPPDATWGAYGILESSRGCAHNCTFCSVNSFATVERRAAWRGVDASTVRDWIVQHRDAGVRHIEFIDADFLGTNQAGLERAAALVATEAPGPSLMIATRADSVTRHPQLIEDLVRWGVCRFQIGVESADPLALARYRKSLLPSVSVEALRLVRSFGAQVRLEFIMFEPESSLRSLEANLEMLRLFHAQGIGVQRALFNRMRIGRWSTDLFDGLARDGRLRRHIFPLYDYVDTHSDVAWVFGALSDAHDHAVGRAVTLSLLVERLQDLGAVSGPTAADLRDLDARLLDFFQAVIDERKAGSPVVPAPLVAELRAGCAAWCRSAVDRLLGMDRADLDLLPALDDLGAFRVELTSSDGSR
jgi:hypothetical protein